jgi:tripartite-type tricarboxylate transporter receptor subunit TctC
LSDPSRALATTAPQRSALLPELPTARESGFATIEAQEWFGIFLPASVPAQAVEQLARAVEAATAKPDVRAALAKQAYDAFAIPGDAFAKLIRAETERWGRVVGDTGFTPLD